MMMIPQNPLALLTAILRDPSTPSHQLCALVRTLRRTHPLPISI